MTVAPTTKESKFFSCSILLSRAPYSLLKNDPPAIHGLDEAIAKMDRFCHKIYNVPITWLCSYAALQKYGHLLARFHKDYGDEIAILEWGISTRSSLGGEVEEYQGWVEECGLERPDDYASAEPGFVGSKGFQDMPYDQLKTALSYLKDHYDRVLGQKTRLLACPFINADTIRAMIDVGLDSVWGYCWNYYCEGMNTKGSLLQPFYVSLKNHNIPAEKTNNQSVLAVQWGPFSPLIAYHVETHSRNGMAAHCLNSLEMTNRSEGLDKFRFHENVIAEYIEHATWNPYAYIPLQLEANWLDEDEISPEQYDQYPTFNPADTEVFYSQIETCLRLGAQPVTISGFSDWHRENVKDTAEMIYHSEDHLPELRHKGKDQPYQPMVLFSNKAHQYWFLKSRGFNYVRKYIYNPQVEEKDIVDEYPFEGEPKVSLRPKELLNMRAGVVLTPQEAYYELSEFELSACHNDPDYAAVLWEANIPTYVNDHDIVTGGAIKGFRTVRQKNLAILFADLKEGANKMTFRSDLPNKYVRIKSVERVGRRYEIWIENDGDEVRLHTLKANLAPGLKIGGFWWDGYYSRTIFRYGSGIYDRDSGRFELTTFYPVTLKVNRGLTRCSAELL